MAGGLVLLSALDAAVRTEAQEHRSPARDQVAAVLRTGGEPEVYVPVPAAIFLAGLATRRPALRGAGERVAGSLVVAGVLTVATKLVVGRLRPNETTEPYAFKPLSGAAAFPSGHSAMAFTLATALAGEIHRPWVTALLVSAAAGTAWSRVNDNHHWLSDVAAGAAIGVASAQWVEGRWQVFRVAPPIFFTGHGRAGIEWRLPVRAG